MDFRELRKEIGEKVGKKCLTALNGVVNKLEETQIQG
jgi:hypothetical protein